MSLLIDENQKVSYHFTGGREAYLEINFLILE